MVFLLAVFVLVIPLAVVGGLILLVARLVSRRETNRTERLGTAIRRFFLYSIMLVTLVSSGVGLGGVIDAAVSTSSQIVQDSSAIARALALVIVGVPVYIGLAVFTSRRLRIDPREQDSLGWVAYLTIALVGSLVATMSLATAFVGTLLVDSHVEYGLLIHGTLWGAVWAGHWFAAGRREPGFGATAHLLLGSAAGLVASVVGITAFTVAALETLYDSLTLTVVVGGGAESLLRPLIIVFIGIPVWWWYWLRHARNNERSVLWHTYVLLFGVLGGVILTITGAGMLLYSILRWVIGDPAASSAVAHFASLPGAIGVAVTGGAVWVYHAHVLGQRSQRDRTEVDRVYDYLLAGAGLVVAASGVATLITVGLDTIVGGDITTADNTIVASLTLLVVGGPLWWRYWNATGRARRDDPENELRSPTRRIYVFVLLGLAAIVAIIALIVLLFLVFEDLLDGSLGRGTISSASATVGLLLTAGAVAWYHFAVFTEDRADAPEDEGPVLREVILVGSVSQDLPDIISEQTGVPVHLLRCSAQPTTVESIDDLLTALNNGSSERVVVISWDGERFETVAIED
ncbi:hypothetical protein MNBD_ACTINO01-1575 [hydrothermal vent metagenome]|uniref:DUF5671 domain-containing protein n=1 Tax=hydrothermal vent metagenome TaxID=652676 RepID=A0A3B0RAJ7_9ZZZZ